MSPPRAPPPIANLTSAALPASAWISGISARGNQAAVDGSPSSGVLSDEFGSGQIASEGAAWRRSHPSADERPLSPGFQARGGAYPGRSRPIEEWDHSRAGSTGCTAGAGTIRSRFGVRLVPAPERAMFEQQLASIGAVIVKGSRSARVGQTASCAVGMAAEPPPDMPLLRAARPRSPPLP